MFFARTQKEHTWKSPGYKFTRQQQEAWQALISKAEAAAAGEEEEDDDEDDDDDDEDDDKDDDKDNDKDDDNDDDKDDDKDDDNEDNMEDDNEDDNEAEADEEQGSAKAGQAKGNQVVQLSRIQKACLRFCIALLDQRITRKEYDSPLVCALAVLGVKEEGWKGAEQYPPILSAIIKVARFMVVQQGLQLADLIDESNNELDNELDNDSAYGSDPRRQLQRPKGYLQLVQQMMDKFMVRGSYGPMQWMLDLRTYGLKIHYNTTSRGHVEWMGQDELLYKDLHFTMPQFRSIVHELATESRRLLTEELLFSSKTALVPAIP
jgi:hypothetical protein